MESSGQISPFNPDVPRGTARLHQVARLQVLQHHLGWLWHLRVPGWTMSEDGFLECILIYFLTSQEGKALLLDQEPLDTASAP